MVHRDEITGRFVSDRKTIIRSTGQQIKKTHIHKCTSCKKTIVCKLPTVMTSHFLPFCQEDYFTICEKCPKIYSTIDLYKCHE